MAGDCQRKCSLCRTQGMSYKPPGSLMIGETAVSRLQLELQVSEERR
jgi:hypothetical protein